MSFSKTRTIDRKKELTSSALEPIFVMTFGGHRIACIEPDKSGADDSKSLPLDGFAEGRSCRKNNRKNISKSFYP